MDISNQIKEISKCIPVVKSVYKGKTDSYSLRTGKGDEVWTEKYSQRYHGQFLHDCLHGRGHYQWTDGNTQKTTYEGMFFCNAMEGYGKISYGDSSFYEGLYKDNIRYGPGVFTHSNGTQDVGLWMGSKLVRLCCVVAPVWVPKLARTPSGKTKLLGYKTLVPIHVNNANRAKEILLDLQSNERVLVQSDELYNLNIRNPNSLFFNRGLYNTLYFGERDCLIDVASLEYDQIHKKTDNASSSVKNCDGGLQIHLQENFCDVVSPKQLRVEWLTNELSRTELLLTRIDQEIKNARDKQVLADQQLKVEHNRKSVSFDVENTSSDSIYNAELWELDTYLRSKSVLEKQLLVTEETGKEGVEYTRACNLVIAAQNAKNLLLNKKNDLSNKLEYENSIEGYYEIKKKESDVCKKVMVTDLLAWNNEKLSIDIMKFVFLHQQFEAEVSFPVVDVLTGDRSRFRPPGEYETDCISFLNHCCLGDTREASILFRKHDLYPNLCDARGNTGIIYAVSNDKIGIIRLLVNFGAGLDVFNDECLTPLLICICRYLAIQKDVVNWESAFLQGVQVSVEEERELAEWRPHVSLTSLAEAASETYPIQCDKFDQPSESILSGQNSQLMSVSQLFWSKIDILKSSDDVIQRRISRLKSGVDLQELDLTQRVKSSERFILNTSCIQPSLMQIKKRTSTRSRLSSISSHKSSTKSLDVHEKVKDDLARGKLDTIYNTITVLLRYGANSNLGEVPFPPIILAMFTKCPLLTKLLLDFKANPNTSTRNEQLTPLHILASTTITPSSVDVLRLLFENGADPNLRTASNHWQNEKIALLAGHSLINKDEGKSPLHLLSMRYDFESDIEDIMGQMVLEFAKQGAAMQLQYIGHTPLSLAILRNNVRLVERLLKFEAVDPNELLGENMGVPLTLLILKRYNNILYSVDYEKIFSLLIDYNANPLNCVGKVGNCIEFMDKEYQEPIINKKLRSKRKLTFKKIKSSATDTTFPKEGILKRKTKENVTLVEKAKALLITKAREVLERHIKAWAVKYLYYFVKHQEYYDEISEQIGKLVTPKETIKILQILIHNGILQLEAISYGALYDLLEFIIIVNSTVPENGQLSPDLEDIPDMLSVIDYKVDNTTRGKSMPEVDRPLDKYEVCLNCLKKKGLQLIICPNCTLVYYCSQECNKMGIRNKTFHTCDVLFYDAKRKIQLERRERGDYNRKQYFVQSLTKLQKERGWDRYSSVAALLLRGPKPDEKRRLHLTRIGNDQKNLQPSELLKHSNESHDPFSDVVSTISLRWYMEGEGFLKWRNDSQHSQIQEEPQRKCNSKIKMLLTERKRSMKEKKEEVKVDQNSEIVSSVSTEYVMTSTTNGTTLKTKEEGKDLKGKTKQFKEKQAKKVTLKSKIIKDVEKMQTKVKDKQSSGDTKEVTDTFKCPPLTESSFALRGRLENKYQRFLEVISELWPDFDMSTLFLPYACYSDGQLFYRFLTNRPLYMETYSRM